MWEARTPRVTPRSQFSIPTLIRNRSRPFSLSDSIMTSHVSPWRHLHFIVLFQVWHYSHTSNFNHDMKYRQEWELENKMRDLVRKDKGVKGLRWVKARKARSLGAAGVMKHLLSWRWKGGLTQTGAPCRPWDCSDQWLSQPDNRKL